MTTNPAHRTVGILLMAFLGIAWGTNWPAIKIAIVEMPIWQYRAVTAGAGGLALMGYAVLTGANLRLPRRQWLPFGGVILSNIGWIIFVGYGVLLMESGQASLIGFTMPIWAAVLAWIFLGEALTVRRLLALGFGISGILLLLAPSLHSFGGRPFGAVLLLCAALSWAGGTIVTKRTDWAVPAISLAAWNLCFSALPIGVIAALSEDFTMHRASVDAWLAAGYTTLFGFILAYIAWFKLVQIFSATVAAIGTLAAPIVGLLSGAIILGEPLGWRQLASAALVFSALALVLLEPVRRGAAAGPGQSPSGPLA